VTAVALTRLTDLAVAFHREELHREAVGAVTGADSVAREGQAQQGKASAEETARQ
jgi:hypothetical protein